MRKILGFTIVLFLFAAAASAQVPTKGNVFLGYSYFSSDLSPSDRANLNGWNASVEGKMFPWVGFVGDFSGHYGTQTFPNLGLLPVVTTVKVREQNYLFGPRISFSAGRIRPFAHALFGAGHLNAGVEGTRTSFATALGGGFDYRLMRVLGWRVQGDYLRTSLFRTRENNVRVSTGLVLRF